MSTLSSQKLVKLNVGGTVFQTTRSTLKKYDCMLRAMLKSGVPVELDPAGCIFIDRDPTHFRLILNFMRDGKIKLPDTQKEIEELRTEADFYCLEELAHFCRNHKYYPPTELNPDYHVLEKQEELFKVLMTAKKDVVVLYFACHVKIRFNQKIIDSFVKKYKNTVEIVFMKFPNYDDGWFLYYYPRGTSKCILKSVQLCNCPRESRNWMDHRSIEEFFKMAERYMEKGRFKEDDGEKKDEKYHQCKLSKMTIQDVMSVLQI